MSKQAEAELILKLYDLRREPTMRKARDWYFMEFHPQTMDDYNAALFGEHSGHLRMVQTYWDMAAALVNNGAISVEMFNDTNGEHLGVFMKLEPILPEIRKAWGPQAMANLEKLIDASPEGRKRVADMRERFKQVQATMTARQTAAAGKK